MNKSELQPIRSAKTGHEQVVSKKAFEENKKLYAPYVAISWQDMKQFELVDAEKNTETKAGAKSSQQSNAKKESSKDKIEEKVD